MVKTLVCLAMLVATPVMAQDNLSQRLYQNLVGDNRQQQQQQQDFLQQQHNFREEQMQRQQLYENTHNTNN